jgi:hypothetical protein
VYSGKGLLQFGGEAGASCGQRTAISDSAGSSPSASCWQEKASSELRMIRGAARSE